MKTFLLAFAVVIAAKVSSGQETVPICGPYLAGTTWDWYHDGSNKNGQVEFTVDKKVKWSGGSPQGSWSVNGDMITTRFNNINHQLRFNAGTGEAVLIVPQRKPASKMIQQGGGSNEDRARAAKSTSSSPKFNIQFENSLSQNACIMWKDYRGNEKQYAQLAPGRGFTVMTYGTHPWIARDCATKKLLLFSNGKKTDVVGEGLAFGAVSGGTIKLQIVCTALCNDYQYLGHKTCTTNTYTRIGGKCDGWPRVGLEECKRKCERNEAPAGCPSKPCKYVIWDANPHHPPGWCQLGTDGCILGSANSGHSAYRRCK